MVREQKQVLPGWLNPESIIDFIDELRDAGYKIGMSQYIAVQDLLLALIAKGEDFKEPQRLKNLIGPLLCSSPTEQKDFQQRFEQWVQRMEFIDRQAVQRDEKAQALGDEKAQALGDEKAQALEREFREIKKQLRRWKWLWLATIAFLAVVGLRYFNYLVSLFSNLISLIVKDSVLRDLPQPPEWSTVLGIFLVPLLTFFFWRLWCFWRAHLFLVRRGTTEQHEIERVSITGLDEELFPHLLFLRISQGFRQRVQVPSNEFNVEGTVEKTVQKAGFFTPVYDYRQVFPEYLVLIDRQNYGDQQARFVTEMIDRLIQNQVFITGYYFDEDPRLCFPMRGKVTPRTLQEIAAKYSNSRLIIFSDAEGFFSSVTGELENWSELFSSWSTRAVLTPKPSEHWGYQEWELSRQFIILPATPSGLMDLIKSIQYGQDSSTQREKFRAPLPEALRVRPRRWIERDPPEPWLLKEVMTSLRSYLGAAGYYWLSACAVFPKLHWNLTLYLGNTLQTEEGLALLQAGQLNDIVRLPWFRYGYMPDWLRIWLIYKLPAQQEQNVRSALEALLVTAVQGTVGSLQLEIARKSGNLLSWLAQPLLHLVARKASEDSPLRDYIFLDFMTGRKQKIAVRLPAALRAQLVVGQPALKVGWRIYLQWVLANVFGGALGFPLSDIVYDSIEAQVGGTLGQAISGAMIGAALGLAQWLIIRRGVSKTGSWVLVTTVSWGMALALYESIGGALGRTVGGATIGAALGFAQWLVIRRRVSKSSSWVLATTVGLAMGWSLGLAIYEAATEAMYRAIGEAMYESVSEAIIGAMSGLVYGVVTGAVLLWLLQNRKQSLA